MSFSSFVAIRSSLSNVGAEAAPTDTLTFITIPAPPHDLAVGLARAEFVEFSFDGLTASGSPDTVTFAFWRSAEGRRDRIGALVVAYANLATASPRTFPFQGQRAWVTVEAFAGGTSPKVSGGNIVARAVSCASPSGTDQNPIHVDTEFTGDITLDPTNLATSAKQDTAQTSLTAIAAANAPATVVRTIALAASLTVKDSAGSLRCLAGQLDAAAPSSTYYVQCLNHATLPANGAVTHLLPPITIIHTLGTPDDYDFGPWLPPGGATASTGVIAVLSTTQFTKTIAGSYLTVAGVA